MLREVHGWILGLILEITYFSLLVTSFSTEHRPRYHIVAPEGRWMNDPNGPFYDEKQDLYHLFYQYNPYDFHWGNMSWYHMVSKDLISWETLPVALYPDKDYDINGVFSGSVFRSVEGKLAIYYTCVDKRDVQRQCIAYPVDSDEQEVEEAMKGMYIEWEKSLENPILQPLGLPRQFRDPFLWTEKVVEGDAGSHEQKDRMIVAAQRGLRGLVLMYEKDSSAPVTSWKLKDELWNTDRRYTSNPDAEDVHMVECPDFFPIMPNGDTYSESTESCGQIYLLKYSLMSTRLDYYELGSYQNARFLPNGVYGFIDHGAKFAYYASKTFWDPKEQRRVLWGWSSETDDDKNDTRNWQGVMALPRYIEYDSSTGLVYMKPIPQIDQLRGNAFDVDSSWNLDVSGENETLTYDLGINSKQIDLILNANLSTAVKDRDFVEIGVVLAACGLSGGEDDSVHTSVGAHFDLTSNKIYTHYNTEHSEGTTPSENVMRPINIPNLSGEAFQSLYEKFELRVLIDHSIIEVFFGNGLAVATIRVYTPSVCDSIGLYTRGYSESGNSEAVSLQVEAHEMKAVHNVDME